MIRWSPWQSSLINRKGSNHIHIYFLSNQFPFSIKLPYAVRGVRGENRGEHNSASTTVLTMSAPYRRSSSATGNGNVHFESSRWMPLLPAVEALPTVKWDQVSRCSLPEHHLNKLNVLGNFSFCFFSSPTIFPPPEKKNNKLGGRERGIRFWNT